MSSRGGAESAKRALSAFGRWIRRRPVRSILFGIILFQFLVPMWRYQPHCGNWASYADFQALDGEMMPDFIAAMEVALWDQGVYHWRVGDRIYVRPLMGLFPSGALDLGRGDLLNAQLWAVTRLVTPAMVGTHVGKELRGRIYQPPEYLSAFLDEEGWPDADDCAFIRAVAFGEPPPPGYKPEPPLLERAPKASP